MRKVGERHVGRAAYPARLEDVARAAGVSLMTVSRVLHRPSKVAVATRKRVDAALRELGYVPNFVGRSLVTKRTRVIASVVYFALKRDLKYLAITVLVLGILTLSLILH